MNGTRAVLITGCSRGLGRALVDAFVQLDHRVFALVRSREAASTLEEAHPGAVHPIVADVTSSGLVHEIAAALENNGLGLDILINNAGSRGWVLSVTDDPEQEVAALFDAHCLGALRVTQAALPFLRRSSSPLVVNITSRLGSMRRTSNGDFRDQRLSYSYRIAKAALNMLTLCLDQELRPQGITVCAVHPGQLLTESGPPGAATTPEEGARRLASWVLSADSSVAGAYRELDSGYAEW